MGLADELEPFDCAEDLFARFGVAFDPRVLAVHRLHVLRRFGIEVRRWEMRSPSTSEAERGGLWQQALHEAHAHFADSGHSPEPPLPGLGRNLVQIRRRPSGA